MDPGGEFGTKIMIHGPCKMQRAGPWSQAALNSNPESVIWHNLL